MKLRQKLLLAAGATGDVLRAIFALAVCLLIGAKIIRIVKYNRRYQATGLAV